ncbi:MAG: hypothetical protein IJX98_07090 [Clostridia bacterium]|nr:hypothetical protein [Clostridia bacterium]
MITSKKALLAGIFDFIAAALCIAALVVLWMNMINGSLAGNNMPEQETDNAVAMIFLLIIFAPIGTVGLLLASVVAIIGGAKLISQARGQLVSHKLFVLALVLKIVGLVLGCAPLILLFDCYKPLLTAIVYIIALAFLLFASIFEACVRKSP